MMQSDDAMAAFAQPPPSNQQPLQHHQQQQQQPLPPAAPPTMTSSQPAIPSNSANANASNNLPYSLYDVVLDLTHPGASSSSPIQIIYPPTECSNGIVDTLSLNELTAEFGPENATATVTPGSAKMTRFAFPEYEDQHNATEVATYQQTKTQVGWSDGNSGNLNHHDGYLEEIYAPASGGTHNSGGGTHNSASSSSGSERGNNNGSSNNALPLPATHVFSHRLANGSTIHGHVRRYLPYHAQAVTENGGRRDVGRRCARALVLLTRNSGGGGRLYGGMLKSLEMLILQQSEAEASSTGNNEVSDDVSNTINNGKLKWFMHSIHQEHVNLCRTVSSAMNQSNTASRSKNPVLAKPWILMLPLAELGRGHGLFGSVDVIKFAIPPSFLHGNGAMFDISQSNIAGFSRNDLLPMLRCLGVPRTLRLLSALMSEKRVIFTCSSASKLSSVAYGAMAMMGQGLLPPPSIFVPVLPPGLASLLQTPSAYLIGVLTGPTPNFLNLRSVANIGEVVLFDLDNTSSNEPCFHNIADPQRSVPDLTRRNVDDLDMASARMVSVADVLYQDLVEVIKMDKKLFWQGAVQEKLGLAAAKGKKVASAAMKKGLKYLKSKSSKSNDDREFSSRSKSSSDTVEEDLDEDGSDHQGGDSNSSLSRLVGKGNYAYEHGFSNVEAEEHARIVFTIFFVSLYGDLRFYLTQQTPGQPPVVDKQKFMKYRAANGDTSGSGMFFLVGNFLRSKMFNSFAEARLIEIQMKSAVQEDAPLFLHATNRHRLNKIDFAMNNIRVTVRQIAMNDNLPGRYLIKWNDSIRNRTTKLTSTQEFNGDYRMTLMQLTEDCQECSSILTNTMMVLWTRLQEGKGLQWKKALLALQAFRHLLLNGPINAVAEAIDGFASIRILKSYTDALRAQNSKLVRDLAVEIYSLVVNLPVLFARRRALINLRRLAKDPKPSPLRKETRMIRGISQFRNIHIALKPAGATVAPAPPAPAVGDLLFQKTSSAPSAGVANSGNVHAGNSAGQSGIYSNDLLSMSVTGTPSPQVAVGGQNQLKPAGVSQSGNYSNDLLAMSFGAAPSSEVVTTDNTSSKGQTKPDPFNMQVMSKVTPKAGPPNTNTAPSQPMVQQLAPQPTPSTSSFAMAKKVLVPPPLPLTQPIQGRGQPQTIANGPSMTQLAQTQAQPAPLAMSFAMQNNAAIPQPIQTTQQQQRPAMMNKPLTSFQPKPHTQPQPHPPLITSFSVANRNQAPSSQGPVQQMQQQPQSMAKAPVMSHPPMMTTQTVQRGNIAMNHHQPPQQQSMRATPQNTAYGFGQFTHGNSNRGPPPAAGYPAMQHTATPSQFQQGANMQRSMAMNQYSQTPSMPQNSTNMNAQKK